MVKFVEVNLSAHLRMLQLASLLKLARSNGLHGCTEQVAGAEHGGSLFHIFTALGCEALVRHLLEAPGGVLVERLLLESVVGCG